MKIYDLKDIAMIVLGGGFHHCSGSSGGGFCAYADITLAIKVHISKVTSSGTEHSTLSVYS